MKEQTKRLFSSVEVKLRFPLVFLENETENNRPLNAPNSLLWVPRLRWCSCRASVKYNETSHTSTKPENIHLCLSFTSFFDELTNHLGLSKNAIAQKLIGELADLPFLELAVMERAAHGLGNSSSPKMCS